MFGQTARRSFGRGCEARLVLSSSLRSDAVSLLLLLLLLLLSHKHSETADYQQTALQSELSTADLHREARPDSTEETFLSAPRKTTWILSTLINYLTT